MRIFLKALLVFILVFTWIFLGFFQIFNFPPEAQEVRAQSGPPVTSGLVLHLDADAITGLSDNDKIAQWDDLSGEGHHATQATEANRPTYKTNILGSKSIVRFDGGDDRLDLSHALVSGFNGKGTVTIFALANKRRHNSRNDILVLSISASLAKVLLSWDVSNRQWVGARSHSTDSFRGITTSETYTTDNHRLIVVEISPASDSNTIWVGGDQKAFGDDLGYIQDTFSDQVGTRHSIGSSAVPADYLNGDIAEILIYDSALSDADRQSVEQYLGEKWLGWEPIQKGFEMGSPDYRIWESSINVGGLDYQESENYRLRETIGEAIVGDASSPFYKLRSGYQPMLEAYIAAAALPEGVTMSPSIGGVTGGQSNGTTSIKVTTDSPSGYSLFIRSSASPALSTSSYSFVDYIPDNPDTPDFNWSVPATTTGFGFTSYGSHTVDKYRYIGPTCDPEDSGGTADEDHCWYNFLTSDESIAASYLSNHPDGTETHIRFRAESGSQNIQSAGEYSATLIITVIPN